MQAQYSMVRNEQGGIKDDIFVYRLARAGEFLLCVMRPIERFSWLTEHSRVVSDCQVSDRLPEIAQIALQGQGAERSSR